MCGSTNASLIPVCESCWPVAMLSSARVAMMLGVLAMIMMYLLTAHTPGYNYRAATFTNWDQARICRPAHYVMAYSEHDIVSAVKSAGSSGHQVRAAGAGHSFSAIALTFDTMLSLDEYSAPISVDRANARVVVQAGIRIRRLLDYLDENGLAITNMGTIREQTLAGAISTGTHGTGIRFGNIASSVVEMRIVLANGTVVHASAQQHSELFVAARVSLGALGVISTITLQVEPAFNLHKVQRAMSLTYLIDHIDELLAQNIEHWQYWWVPHSDAGLYMQFQRTTAPVTRSSLAAFWDDHVAIRVFDGLLWASGFFPNLTPWLNSNVFSHMLVTSADYVVHSWRGFSGPSPHAFVYSEMEMFVPVEHTADALRACKDVIDAHGFNVNFVVTVRFVAGDDIPLSPAYGRDSMALSVSMNRKPQEFARFYTAVQKAMHPFGGRPHWGKNHNMQAAELQLVYPKWNEFASLRQEVDPRNMFTNDYVKSVLGLSS
eukprot:TRINITY_DN12391_c0_g1_i2.p1 TRINITY_DN12391_c0_g1~~TRINITY_DN12391_c0_g1_i2.p1  ORF type:complete len:490 (-),score=71.24 TRINITY_DN12391_c0_g1_i2:78-1547(-)